MSCGTATMPHGHNGRDGEAENCQVRKCRSAVVCLPLRGDPGERRVDSELSVRPWTRVAVPFVAVAVGPRRRDRGPWLDLSATVGRVLEIAALSADQLPVD